MNRGTDPSCPLRPSLHAGIPLHDLPPFHPLLSLPLEPPRSSRPCRSLRGPLPRRSLFLPPFRFASFSLSLVLTRPFSRPLYLSVYLSRSVSLSRLTHGCRSRARTQGTVRRCRRVDERFVGARGRDQTHRPFPPFPRAVTRPRFHRPSIRPFVRSFVPPLRPLYRSLPPSPTLPFPASFFPPVSSGKPRRENPSKTDRRRLAGESLSPHSLAAKLYYSLLRILSGASRGPPCISRPLPVPPQIVPFSR